MPQFLEPQLEVAECDHILPLSAPGLSSGHVMGAVMGGLPEEDADTYTAFGLRSKTYKCTISEGGTMKPM